MTHSTASRYHSGMTMMSMQTRTPRMCRSLSNSALMLEKTEMVVVSPLRLRVMKGKLLAMTKRISAVSA